MDTLGFLVGALVAVVCVCVGGGLIMMMHHIQLHAKLTEQRERDTVTIRPASPRHVERIESPLEQVEAPRQPAARPSTTVRAAPVRENMRADVPLAPAGPAPTEVPVDVVYNQRAGQPPISGRGGNG